MADDIRLGAKVRSLRRTQKLRQSRLAEMLGISPSYLNLIEHDRRPLTAPLLLKLAELFQLDLRTFASDSDARLASELMEVFGDRAFDRHPVTPQDVRDLAVGSPAVGRGVLHLYRLYREAHDSAVGLASRLTEDGGGTGVAGPRLPAEEVSDFLQARMNHVPQLEAASAELWTAADLRPDDMYHGLSGYLAEVHGVRVTYVEPGADRGAVRHYDPGRRVLVLSESLPRSSRKFQIAHTIALVQHGKLLDRLALGPDLSDDTSRALARVALANYYAGAVVMPYERFIETVRETRYDIDLLENRFGASFEQVCHRLTTLRRPGDEGIPFHFVRTDIAGNISKRFNASGIQMSRFGSCPRWNLHSAFLTPGRIIAQLSTTPDGSAYFCVARTVAKGARGHHAPKPVQAITIGCDVRVATEMVYADGFDLERLEAGVPIGPTCRVCDRTDCEQRAFPPMTQSLRIDPNVRGVSFYAAPAGEDGAP